MLLELFVYFTLSLTQDVSFYILNEGLIRPDQDDIMSRPNRDYNAADFGDEYYNPKTGKNNLGKVTDPIVTNNIETILSKIIKPDPNILNTDSCYIEWYVMKKEDNVNWHIDGQMMPYEHITVYFYNQNELYTTTHVRKDSNYYFDNDVLIWRNGQIVNGKTFNYWKYYDDYTQIDATGRAFLASQDMKFYAVWMM